jgi:hypothetical protein
MTAPAMPRHAEGFGARLYHRAFVAVAKAGDVARVVGKAAKASSRVSLAQLRDHFLTIAAFGLVDAAMFTHSLFTGLIVTGASVAVFEWKVSD